MAVAQRSGGNGRVSGSASGLWSRFSYNSRVFGLILMPFLEPIGIRRLLILICLPCGNDADDLPAFVRAVHEHGHEKGARGSVPDSLVTNLSSEFAIFDNDQAGIEEDLFRLSEANAVLCQIAFRLLRVPGEFNFDPVSL